MKVVVTGDYMFNNGDVSWAAIEAVCNPVRYERTPPGLIAERCKGADVVVINKTPINRETIDALPGLKLITVFATGYNMVDLQAATEKGITVCNVPAYSTASVAQHCFALILELTNSVGMHAASVARGDWDNNIEWCYNLKPINGLEGKTIGIVGYGAIGRQTAMVAKAFGMKVLYNSRSKKEDTNDTFVSLEELFAQSDVISLHCPLTAENKQFVDKSLIKLMKPSAMLINTARGPLINEDDLAYALNNNLIGGAGLDVLSTEPPAHNNPLLTAKNCIITPHNAWMSLEARQRVLDITAVNIKSFMEGKPVNVVN